MTFVDDSRWSCPAPGCHKTVTVYGSPDDVACAIDACQRRHSDEHRKAAAVARRLAMAKPYGRRRSA